MGREFLLYINRELLVQNTPFLLEKEGCFRRVVGGKDDHFLGTVHGKKVFRYFITL
jgi:hypothetical protein